VVNLLKSKQKKNRVSKTNTSWDPLARWYDGWVGQDGSRHHRQLAIPAVLELLELQPGQRILDIGCGQGVLAPYVARTNAKYTGVDLSASLLQLARQRHGKQGRFLRADACRLAARPGLLPGSFDAVIFLLSIQDMQPLQPVLQTAAAMLVPGGRMVILMTHPCFRIPRQSGWSWDPGRKLQSRRVDRYLTPLTVPLKAYPGSQHGVSHSFHRPLGAYINALAACDLLVDNLLEIPSHLAKHTGAFAKAKARAQAEIPLFLGLRARKVGRPS